MSLTFWERVRANGLKVPEDRPLSELTTELTAMLGDPNPAVRDGIAYPTLDTWIVQGVYDDLLEGLGDGMAAGLTVGLGEDGTDTVFRRSFSVLVLAECIRRDNKQHLVPARAMVTWGDRIASWFIRERDLRGFVKHKGWAHSVAHGADAIGELAMSEAMGRLELTVLLDVIADRLLLPTQYHLVHGEPDRLALATMRVLRRDLVGIDVIEPWLARLGQGARAHGLSEEDPYLIAGNTQSFLRALHLQLALAPNPPATRPDVLLAVIERLRESNPEYLSNSAAG
ncbi:MAG TPA: DUF2785 domain-containing protein [Nocardioidaceae bacterium]|nr:DUF2785 domain-containing protein [Nocardioidaceae bacterium]